MVRCRSIPIYLTLNPAYIYRKPPTESFGGTLALFMTNKLCACIGSDASNLCLKGQCAKLDQLYLHLRTCEHIQMWPCEQASGAKRYISIPSPNKDFIESIVDCFLS